MNLSSYLQMPPAPNASKSPTTSPAAGPAAGARVDAGNSLGLDFAQIMSRQLERLPQVERQSFAASAPQMKPAPEASRHQTQKRSDAMDDRNADSDQRDDGTTKRSQNRQQDQDNTAAVRQASNDLKDTNQDTQPRAHKTRATQKALTAQEQIDAALLQAMSPVAPVNTPLASTAESKSALQTIALSPQIQIITDPKQAPSNESLAAFAKSMGLDESVIQTLIAGGNPAALSNSGDAMRAALAAQDPLTQGVLTTGAQTNASPSLMAALHSQSLDQSTVAGAATLNANLTQQTAALAQAASGSASLLAPDTQALPGALLPPMSAADLASIEQIQITVMPAAVALNGNASNLPSTLDVLSLMTGDLKEQDISALSTQFNEAGGNDQPADQQPSSNSGDNTSFGQVLNRQANQNAPATSANQASCLNAGSYMAACSPCRE